MYSMYIACIPYINLYIAKIGLAIKYDKTIQYFLNLFFNRIINVGII